MVSFLDVRNRFFLKNFDEKIIGVEFITGHISPSLALDSTTVIMLDLQRVVLAYDLKPHDFLR